MEENYIIQLRQEAKSHISGVDMDSILDTLFEHYISLKTKHNEEGIKVCGDYIMRTLNSMIKQGYSVGCVNFYTNIYQTLKNEK